MANTVSHSGLCGNGDQGEQARGNTKDQSSFSTSAPTSKRRSHTKTQTPTHHTSSLQHTSPTSSSTTGVVAVNPLLYNPTPQSSVRISPYDYILHGISSQFAHVPHYNYVQQREPGRVCPYHASILNYPYLGVDAGLDQDYLVSFYEGNEHAVLYRYLDAGPEEQYALYNRGETNVFNTEKGCVCGQV